MTAILDGDNSYYLPELSTPLELNLHAGEKIRSYPFISTFSRPAEIADIIEPDETKVELRANYSRRTSYQHGGGFKSGIGHRREYKGGHSTQLMGLAAGAKLSMSATTWIFLFTLSYRRNIVTSGQFRISIGIIIHLEPGTQLRLELSTYISLT